MPTLTVTDGLGVVRVAAGPDVSVLFLAGEPAVVESSDYRGSLGWLAARAGPWPDADGPRRWLGSAWDGLGDWLAAPPEAVDPSVLAPLLDLLDPGDYTAEFVELSVVDVRSPAPDGVVSWYSDDSRREVVPVHRWPAPDGGALARYGRAIRAGIRPAGVLLRATEDSAGFLLDGHHKLAAYLAAGVPARFLELVRVDAPRLAPGELAAALPRTAVVQRAFGRVPGGGDPE